MMTADLRGEESASPPALLCPTPGQPLSSGSRSSILHAAMEERVRE